MYSGEEQPPSPARSVLVIDDSPLIRRLVAHALGGDQGWQVHEADSGESGIEVAARERPDAILLDVEMPGLSGPETLNDLAARETTRGVPVLFLTGLSAHTEPADLLAVGADGVIAKPFDPATLSRRRASSSPCLCPQPSA